MKTGLYSPFKICFCLIISLLLLSIVMPAVAQLYPSDRELFDFPDSVECYFAYHPTSDQAVLLVPAEGVATIVFEMTPFEEVHQGMIDPAAWQTPDSIEIYPDDTVVLRSSAGEFYKVACNLVSGPEVPQIAVTYAPVPPVLPDETTYDDLGRRVTAIKLSVSG